MLMNFSQKTLIDYCGNTEGLKKLSNGYFELRFALIDVIKQNGITQYQSFLNLMNAVAPFEDEAEIYRFWHGYFFSEYFVDFISELVKKFHGIDLTPFRDKVMCKCSTCGTIILKDKIVRNERRNKSR